MFPVISNNNGLNIVSDFDDNSSEEDFKNSKDNFFDNYVDGQVKISLQTTVNVKVVQAMKKLEASYNVDANNIIDQATNEKSVIKNSNFLIDLSMMTTNTKPVPEEPKTFSEAWNHPNPNSHAKW